MPYKPARPCPGRGPRRGSCPNLIRGSQTCCPDCLPYEKAKIKRYDKARDETPERQFLHSTTWHRIRDQKLNRDPLCQRCQESGIITGAVLVHHVDENQFNNNENNLLSLCTKHHEEIHKDGRWGR